MSGSSLSEALSRPTPCSVRPGARAGSTLYAPERKYRLRSIQVFRGFAALLVVCQHLYGLELKYFHTHHMRWIGLGWVGVDLFFVISGVVISLVTEGKFGKPRNAAKFLYHRFARIYPIFWVYFAMVLAAYIIMPQSIDASTGHQADLLRSFFLIPSQHGNLLYQAWTLSYEIVFYTAFGLLMLAGSERTAHYSLSAWACLIAADMAWRFTPGGSYVLATVTSMLIYEFLIGCLVFLAFRRFFWRTAVYVAMIAVGGLSFVVLVVLTIHLHGSDTDWIENSLWLRPGICGPSAGLMLLGAMGLERAGQLKFPRVLSSLGDWSYSIYLSHTIVIKVVGHVVRPLVSPLSGAIVYLDAVAIPIVILVGYLSYTYLEVPMMTFCYHVLPRGALEVRAQAQAWFAGRAVRMRSKSAPVSSEE